MPRMNRQSNQDAAACPFVRPADLFVRVSWFPARSESCSVCSSAVWTWLIPKPKECEDAAAFMRDVAAGNPKIKAVTFWHFDAVPDNTGYSYSMEDKADLHRVRYNY